MRNLRDVDVKKLASNDVVEVLGIFDVCLANRAEYLVIRLQRLKSAWWTVTALLKGHFHVIVGDHTDRQQCRRIIRARN